MWRAFFLAIGVYCCMLGAECLVIDRAVLASDRPMAALLSDDAEGGDSRNIVPPDWAPWSLLSAGAVTMLYSFTLPRKVKD